MNEKIKIEEYELLYCPFCASYDLTVSIEIGECAVLCINCEAKGPEVAGVENAIKKWNERNKNYGTYIIRGNIDE